MTCKDCIHFEVCNDKLCRKMSVCTFMSCTETTYIGGVEKDCKNFKDKSKIIELPCKVGDVVYQTDGVRIYESKIDVCEVWDNQIIYCTPSIAFDKRAIGETVFLAREEAEKSLGVRNGLQENYK